MKHLAFLFALISFMPSAWSAQCTLDKNSAEVGWTAFKTTQRAGVKGVFKTVNISGPTTGKSLKKLLEGLSVEVDINSMDSFLEPRNVTLRQSFFGKLADPKVSGRLSGVNEAAKTAQLDLTFNGQQHPVKMTYTLEADTLTATGSMDVLQFGANTALDTLHKACEKLHAGSDGVSKTWPDVTLTLKGKIACK